MTSTGRYHIELDTGGTFTDGYVSSTTGSVRAKVNTTPHDPSEGILSCIDHAASLLGLDRPGLLRQTDTVRLSTTVGTNILINRDGAKVGLLVDAKMHEAVAGRLSERLPLSADLVTIIPEAGDEKASRIIVAGVRQLLERGARILVIALSDDGHLVQKEQAVRSTIAEEYPRHYLGAVPVVPSHEITLASDSLVRVNTSVLDAYLHPMMARFLYRVEDELRKSGYSFPLLVAQSNGGTSRVAKTTAIRTWGSGPAGGVAGGTALARGLELSSVVVIDVGGTSSDVTVIADGDWRYDVQPDIDGVAVSLPSLRLESIGIGGGSIASIDGAAILVGPKSAGAQPGPAAFGLGGTEPTVTDACCALGYFDPTHFLGGRKTLDVGAARKAIEQKIARPLGQSIEQAARLILRTAAETVAKVVTETLKARGIRSSQAWLFAAGGAGGLLAAEITAKAKLAGFYAFPLSAVFSAFGLSQLDLLHVYEASFDVHAQKTLESLIERAKRDMRGEGVDISALEFTLEAELASAEGTIDAMDLGPADPLARALSQADKHRQNVRVLRLKARIPREQGQAMPSRIKGQASSENARAICWNGKTIDSPVYDWNTLGAGASFEGPAMLENEDTTIPIPGSWIVKVGAFGEIRVTRGTR